MGKKRSCRRTDGENRIHDKAVKLRKMTDEQLVSHVENLAAQSRKSGTDIARFIEEISNLRGIGSATVNKIKAYAADRGYVK